MSGLVTSSQSLSKLHPEIWKNESHKLLSRQVSALPWYSNYDVVFTHLDLHLERNTVYVEGNVATTARSKVQGLDSYRCELISALTVDSATFNGQPTTVLHFGDTVIVHLNPGVALGESFTVRE